ncbi:serine/threonine-protein kinase DCLK1 [Drosophila rhopaloa]|uniref:Doublecortin-like and CAM kinase-like protein n=1 Tax=Drosophila rhopaloa TaxID=1041015 RepID=A0ABM5I2R0_DRORH|nr:serine/threonine-protein kinase DCLK1 [Drosophila rhopaloa]
MFDKDKLLRPKRLQPRPLKALRVCFLRNGDQHFKGVNMAVSHEHFKDFYSLLQAVTEALRRHVVLRSAIVNIVGIDGYPFTSLGCFSEGDVVICCCKYEELIWVRYSINKVFLRLLDSRNRWQDRRLDGETLENIMPNDLPDAIHLYINNLEPMVQTARTLIYRGQTRFSWTQCIVKVVNKQFMDYNCGDPYIEPEVLRRLQSHPNIIELMYSVEEPRYLYMVLECLDCDLEEVILDYGPMSEANARSVVRGTVAGLAHMHQLQLIHRDIKPENLLLRFSPGSGHIAMVKITDFGMTAYYRGSKLYCCCGTPCYMAPELIAESGYDYPVDSWSLGVTLFYILYGKLPFSSTDQTVVEVYATIMSGEPSYPMGMEDILSSEARHLIDGLLTRNPNKRLTIAETAQHPFLS